jgi:hypothetical protein
MASIATGIITGADAGLIGDFERTSPFSIELWLYPTSDRTNASLIGNLNNGRGWHIVTHGSRGKIMQIDFGMYHDFSGNAVVITNSTALNLPINNWYHVVFTYTGSSTAAGVKCYVNNVLRPHIVAVDALTSTIKNTAKLLIGTGYYSFSAGRVDEVVLYDRTLGAAEVGQRYNSGNGTEALFGTAYLHYNLNETSGVVVNDDSGNLRHAKTIGNPSWVAGKLNNCLQLNGSSQYIEA